MPVIQIEIVKSKIAYVGHALVGDKEDFILAKYTNEANQVFKLKMWLHKRSIKQWD